MPLNTKSLKVALIVGIITLIMIGFYGISDQDTQVQITPPVQSNQSQATGKDPFQEFLDKQQQQGTSLQASQAQPIQTIQIGDRNSATTVPVGNDPFKAFVEAHSKAKPDEAAISPFSSKK